MKEKAYPTIDMKATGERIRQLRSERNIKVDELREYMGFDCPQAIYKWQKGQSIPSVDNLFALSRYLEVPVEEILVESFDSNMDGEDR